MTTEAATTTEVPASTAHTAPTSATPTTAVPSTTAPPSTTTTTALPPTTAVSTTTTTVPPRPAEWRTLRRGDDGAEVAELQERLRQLRFWVGPADGVFGWLTEQAVYAFQRANGIAVDGKVGVQTRAALRDPVPPSPRSRHGRVIEIDKGRQLVLSVSDGELQRVFHTSTGTEQPYQHPDGYTAMADTPPGRHTVDWHVDGWSKGRLGPMYRPKFFHHDGIALHGYHAVPPHPVSHGCARVTFDAMDYIWAHDLMPIGSVVLVYGTSPPPRAAG